MITIPYLVSQRHLYLPAISVPRKVVSHIFLSPLFSTI